MKRLYRNTQRGKIGGVCAGLAYHFNVDVSLVRSAFLLFALMGYGIIGYLIMWMVTPQLKSNKRK